MGEVMLTMTIITLTIVNDEDEDEDEADEHGHCNVQLLQASLGRDCVLRLDWRSFRSP